MTTPGELTPRGYRTISDQYLANQLHQAITDLADDVDADVAGLTAATDAGAFLAASYGTYGGAYPVPRITKAQDGAVIELSGCVTRVGTTLAVAAGTTYQFGTLPVGCRPLDGDRMFLCPTGVTGSAEPVCRVVVQQGGALLAVFAAAATWSIGGNGYLALDPIRFRIDLP